MEIDKELLDSFVKKLLEEENRKSRWILKITDFLFNYQGDIDELYEKFIEHDNKVSDMLWNRHIDGQSDLSYLLVEVFHSIGKEEETDNDFSCGKYVYRGIVCELLIGQGSKVLIYKK